MSAAPCVVAASAAGPRWRPVAVAFTTALSCVFWCLTLSKLDAGNHAFPWYATLVAISILCLGALLRGSRFGADDAVHVTGFRNREPLKLLEALAISYLVASLILYLFAMLSIYMPKKQPIVSRHVVDIEFTSLTDRKDNEALLPGEQQTEEIRKRTGDLVTVQGTFTPRPAAPVTPTSTREQPKPLPEKKREFVRSQEPVRKPVPPPTVASTPVAPPIRTPLGIQKPVNPQPLAMPSNWATQVVQKFPPRKVSQKREEDTPMFEEVQPPELVEMVDNDGSTESTKISQGGGRSTGGTGAQSELNTYLKELHKKIKTAWVPPRGQSRRAEILFRIKKPGRLSSIKLVKSSGDNETDEAAMQAVTAAVKGQPDLPPSFQSQWLDVIYTFNYTADELQEVRKAAASED